MIKWHRANMISYLSGLMLTMQVLGSAAWIPVPELYLWGHMEDKTERNVTVQKRKKMFSEKEDHFQPYSAFRSPEDHV